MDVIHNGGSMTQFAVSTIDSIRFTNASDDAHNPSHSSDSLAGAGLYLGVMGFNQQLYTQPISILDNESKNILERFIDNLQIKNGTILCYSVEKAIEALRSYPLPNNLASVAIVTFTDGLDQGSLMMSDQYDTDDEYLASLNRTIRNEKIGGVQLTAYSIGLRGSDVTTSANITKFQKTLKQLASADSYATEVNNMSEVKSRFQEIARQLNTQVNLQNVEVRIPGLSTGTRVRFTFDNVSSASSSNIYIEGTFDLVNRTLTNVVYHGMTSTSGVTVSGYAEDIFVTFHFNGIQTADNKMLSKSNIKEWYQTSSSSSWQINSEFNPDQQPDIQTIRSSAVIMLVLDCSSSLGSKFADVKTNAKSFINTLYNSYDNTIGGNDQTTYEYVDLGLSVYWATCNVGAENPEEYGDYYAWGETETKNEYSWSTYKYCKGSVYSMTKYCSRSDYGYNDYTDNLTILEINDDIAHSKWGGGWRLPTLEDYKELYNNCTWTYTTLNGVEGFRITSNKSGYTDRSIFLPTTGFKGQSTNYSLIEGYSYYMLSDLNTSYPSDGYSIRLGAREGNYGYGSIPRYSGLAVRPIMPKDVKYEYVDLGLSVKWATCNVGATKPEDYGDYYAWGETETRDTYSWSTYKWCNGSYYTLTKYNTRTSYGTVDNKTVLDPEDDVAHVKWGGSWRMPTKAEQEELLNSCTWTWYSSGNSEFNGVAGYKVTSNKSGYTDRFIFLPAAGCRYDTSLSGAGELGDYWSSSLDTGNPYLARGLIFDSGVHYALGNARYRGQSVRPVCP